VGLAEGDPDGDPEEPVAPPGGAPPPGGGGPPRDSPAHRVIFVNRPQISKFSSNYITTAKYNVLSFLPCFLFEQFRRYSNCFFLFIAMMQVGIGGLGIPERRHWAAILFLMEPSNAL